MPARRSHSSPRHDGKSQTGLMQRQRFLAAATEDEGSPPFKRATRFPAPTFSTSSALISVWVNT